MLYKFFVLLTLFFTMIGCQEVQKASVTQTIKTEVIIKDGILRIEEGNSSYILADDAIDYDVVQSPQGTWLIANTLLLSNIQIIRVYKKDSSNKFQKIKASTSRKLWADLAKKEHFDIEDVRYPKIQFIKWLSENSMLVNVSGEIKDKKIDSNIAHQLN